MYYWTYEDDGAIGFCGQTVDNMGPKRKLFVSSVYIAPDIMQQQLKLLSAHDPRITDFFSDDFNKTGLNNVVDITEFAKKLIIGDSKCAQ